jgi:hypothetical protein
MGLGTAWGHLWSGEFRYAFDSAFIPDSEIDRSQKTDEALRALNIKQLEDDKITETEFRNRQARLSGSAFPSYDDDGRIFDQGTDPWSGFEEGLGDGVSNIKNAMTATTSKIFGSVPWQIWAVVGVYVLVMLAPYFLPKKT